MGRKCIVLVLFLLLAQWGEAQDVKTVAEQFKQSEEELSEPMNLLEGTNTYTLYFYMKDGVPVGAIAFDKSGETVLDPVLYKRLVCAAFFLGQDLEKFYAFLEGSGTIFSDMNKLSRNLDDDNFEDLEEIVENGANIPGYPDRAEEILDKLDDIYSGIDEVMEKARGNWIMSNKDKFLSLKEGDIEAYEFLAANIEKLREEFDSLSNALTNFSNQVTSEKSLTREFMSLNVDFILGFGMQIEPAYKEMFKKGMEAMEKEEEEVKKEVQGKKAQWNSKISSARQILDYSLMSDETAEEFVEDLYEGRIPPRLTTEVTLPEKETQGTSIPVSLKVRNEGSTDARRIKVALSFDTFSQPDTLETLPVGEEKVFEYTIDTKDMKSGAKTLTVDIAYEGIRGNFSLHEEKGMTLKYNYVPIAIGGGILAILIVASILVMRMKKKKATPEQPAEPLTEQASTQPESESTDSKPPEN